MKCIISEKTSAITLRDQHVDNKAPQSLDVSDRSQIPKNITNTSNSAVKMFMIEEGLLIEYVSLANLSDETWY
jgi:hypothetical protein